MPRRRSRGVPRRRRAKQVLTFAAGGCDTAVHSDEARAMTGCSGAESGPAPSQRIQRTSRWPMGPRVAGASAPLHHHAHRPAARAAGRRRRPHGSHGSTSGEFAGGRACFTEIRSNRRSDRPREFPLRGSAARAVPSGSKIDPGAAGQMFRSVAATSTFAGCLGPARAVVPECCLLWSPRRACRRRSIS
jgi:hypothetical protein